MSEINNRDQEETESKERPEKLTEKNIDRRDFIAMSGKVVAGAYLATTGLSSLSASAEETKSLNIITTTDEHQYILPYNYMDDAEDQGIGLSKAYTIIEEEREEHDNTLLVSNGDVIQGSIISDYEFRIDPLEEGETQTIVNIFNELGYEAAAVGNHELQDYGLGFFDSAVAGANFPWLAANMRVAGSDENYVESYKIIEKEIDGEIVKIGLIGFVPPPTMRWGREHLDGEVEIDGIAETAERLVPEIREQADIVIALAHTGIDDTRGGNEGLPLAQVDGFDALIFGHDHNFLPGDYEEIEMVNSELGLINGVPSIMAGSWGRAVGIVDLELMKENGEWRLAEAGVRLRRTGEDVQSHERVEDLAADIHADALEYIRTPITDADEPFTSFFARVKDAAITQIINEAQLNYGRNFVAANPEYEDYGVLAAAAPFRFGREGPRDFTRVSDEIRISDVNDIYMFPNEIRIVEFDGEMVLDWLEYTAANFNQIDPDAEGRQELINPNFPGFNWDIIEGIKYEIDITQPVGERIVNATYEGEPLNEDQNFLIVTNDHRASGGGEFPHLDGETIIYSTPTTHQEIIIEFLDEHDPVRASNNWRIVPFEYKGELIVHSHPDGPAYIEQRGLDFIEYIETDDDGWGIYRFTFED